MRMLQQKISPITLLYIIIDAKVLCADDARISGDQVVVESNACDNVKNMHRSSVTVDDDNKEYPWLDTSHKKGWNNINYVDSINTSKGASSYGKQVSIYDNNINANGTQGKEENGTMKETPKKDASNIQIDPNVMLGNNVNRKRRRGSSAFTRDGYFDVDNGHESNSTIISSQSKNKRSSKGCSRSDKESCILPEIIALKQECLVSNDCDDVLAYERYVKRERVKDPKSIKKKSNRKGLEPRSMYTDDDDGQTTLTQLWQ